LTHLAAPQARHDDLGAAQVDADDRTHLTYPRSRVRRQPNSQAKTESSHSPHVPPFPSSAPAELASEDGVFALTSRTPVPEFGASRTRKRRRSLRTHLTYPRSRVRRQPNSQAKTKSSHSPHVPPFPSSAPAELASEDEVFALTSRTPV